MGTVHVGEMSINNLNSSGDNIGSRHIAQVLFDVTAKTLNNRPPVCVMVPPEAYAGVNREAAARALRKYSRRNAYEL